jgi:hypothetical protein
MVIKFSRLSDADQVYMLEYVKIVEQWQTEHPGQVLNPAENARLQLQADARARRAGDQP